MSDDSGSDSLAHMRRRRNLEMHDVCNGLYKTQCLSDRECCCFDTAQARSTRRRKVYDKSVNCRAEVVRQKRVAIKRWSAFSDISHKVKPLLKTGKRHQLTWREGGVSTCLPPPILILPG